ncbi:hypothetical protein ALT_2304 [Aspergillus lentulus]|uniref:Cell surface protein n=1 Tax=Aspergillus lentulus TaxID=293939 RepID=A0AAN4PEZ2_ASPLE|nr:uncharacterized protein IFM58399_05249 [Aspergillus lentulus]GAQ04983.1 hypothetical protein ALT_2304 [Aspergillus lentulus]GFF38481.1 hypothetical protein IFM58399_05249 [Aspergillus lentulus]GFF71632.1 hypothetical protein IFM62136_08133 [Aspergillus lentulus]GFF83353.1 hypothetical protein IFM60648_06665 [Aspergillus lentulus]GFF89222.1 hypothetical protein IFM47457_08077 [Aspergillus lentulus]
MKFLPLLLATTLASTVYARTDLEGCISSKTHNQWNEASMIWYVPGTGEICDIPDCGGGRAPPKRDNPACPGQYTGTATYEPSYLPGYGPGAAASTKTLAATASASTTGDAMTTKSTEASSLVITAAPSMTASVTATMKTSIKAGNSSSVASTTSSSAGATETGNNAGMLELNVVGVMAAAALAVAAL